MSVLGQRRGKTAKTALAQGTCSAWAFGSLCSAKPQGLCLLDERCLSEKKLKGISHWRTIPSRFDLTNALCPVPCSLRTKVLNALRISNSLGVISLPRCIVPLLRVLNPVVTFEHCCLKVPCEEKLTLVNDSDIPGCYCVLPQVWSCIHLLPSNVPEVDTRGIKGFG